MGDDPKNPRFILSVRGVGYKFVNALFLTKTIIIKITKEKKFHLLANLVKISLVSHFLNFYQQQSLLRRL